jgi:hypothetical protein
VTETYVCPHCTAVEERSYRVQFFIVTCDECGENGRFIHASLLDVLDSIPEADRPDGWESMPLDERLLHAVREGILAFDDTRV